ncbi:hypothetical protein GQ457_13G008680 [Hibiscus cannabinus]
MEFEKKKRWKSLVSRLFKNKSASCCFFPKVKPATSSPSCTPVYLNVYDLTPMNGYMYWAGLGIFHSGVEVYGVEYAFGAHDYPTSGVFEVEPRQCPGFKFKKSIFIGTTALDPGQVRDFMEHYSERYNGDTYHLIAKNCNHFCADICKQLTGKRIPKWVNRLAKIGSMCNCILPEGLKTSVVKHEPNYESEYGEKKRRRCGSSCLALVSGQLKSSLLESSSSSCLLAPSELER